MVKAPSMGPAGGPAGIRRIHPGPEIAMNPRNLPTASASMPPAMRGDANAVDRTTPQVYHPQVDVSTQVDLHGGYGAPGNLDSWDRRATPLYSREDIKEQYCITSRQLDAVEKSGGGFFGCLSTRGPSPCSSTRNSILSACVRSVPSDENLCDAPYPRRPLQIMYRQPYPTYARGLSRYDLEDEADWIESSYFRRRPRSFCTVPDPKRYTWVPEDEESMRLEGPRPVLPPVIPLPPSLTTMQGPQVPKTKHVSFARSHTLTSFEVPRNRSPPRPHNPERLIDSQPTMQNAILPSSLPLTHPYPGIEPRVLVLEKPPKRGAMKTQATQTEIPAMFRGRVLPVTLSPRTIHRVKMVSQGAQTNGIFNGRKLTKSYSEAGQLGTPLGGGQVGAPTKEEIEHEPLHRTQSEEPPRSPFLVSTTPPLPPSSTTVVIEESLPNGDIVPAEIPRYHRKSLDIDDQEIFINFKPAPVSPDARALLSRISEPTRRFLPLQKTFSDGEIRIERRELIGESSEPSYPHTCRRNQQDSWGRVRTPVQFSSTPEDLSLLRSLSPHEDHHEEEFHENLIRRGLFRKRSVSLEDGVQGLSSDDFMLPRSLPTSPTSPTAAAAPRRILQTPKDDSLPSCALLPAAICPAAFSIGTGIPGTSIIGQAASPFASSDSLTNDVTRDHSDGIWNESQATVLQADSLALLTPSSRRRHLLLLQHQQRSSMDTEALDVEDEVEPCPPSPRIRLEPATPVQPLTPRRHYRIQDLLPVQFQQIYYNDVSATAHFYAYDIIESSISASNGRPRSGLRRASPGPPLSQPQSQSSSEFGLSLARTDSGGRTNTDLSETSEDYVTANTSTETGTTTGTSATTSSWSRPPQTSSAAASAASAPASTTATAAEGSSFESASSIYSLARSEAVIEEPCSPPPILEEAELAFGLELPPPMRSSSSSSSGSYDLKDAMTDPNNDLEQVASPSGHTSETELDRDEGHRSSSGGYAESPPDVRMWSEEERRRKKKTFSLDFLGSASNNVELEHSAEPAYSENVEVSPTPSHRHRSRSKPTSARSPHRNNRKRDAMQQSTQQQQQQQQQPQHMSQQSNIEQSKAITNDANGESRDDNSSNQNHANGTNPALANMKEKTPMCLLNELARFNRIQHQYRLTNEQGPAHKKRFTVTLKLGEEEYVAEGPSIKKAQHSAATEALTKTWYRQPPPKPTKAMRIGHLGKCPAGSGHLPPTVELNALAMKRGEPTVYTFRQAPPATLQHQFMPHSFNNFPRMYNPRIPYNRGVHTDLQALYLVTLKVGEREFTGRGLTGQAARHDAASRALEQLRQLPLPEEIATVNNTNENGTLNGIDDPNAELKSPVSLVHETALKRGLSVSFEVVSESGKPHIRTFMTKCTVGDKVTVGEGSSKKVSKKRAAELMLEELKRLPPLPATIQNRSMRVKRKPPATKKKSRNLIKVYQEPRSESEAAEEVNPVSRLVQIQQAKREREPVYNLIDEKGAPRRREFVMEVTMGQHSAQGIGPNKKLAKRAAAEALLAQLGYSKPSPQPAKPSIKTGDSENTESKPRKVTFLEDEQVNDTPPHSVGGTIGRQLVPGLLLVDGGQESKLGNGPSVQIVAEELRGQQQNAAGVSPKDQLHYLSQLFNFTVEFSDFPKGVSINKEYLSLVSLSTDPPQVCHGNGATIAASRNQAALRALRTLSKLGLDNASNAAQVKKDKGASGDGIHISIQVKNNMDGAIDK